MPKWHALSGRNSEAVQPVVHDFWHGRSSDWASFLVEIRKDAARVDAAIEKQSDSTR